MIEWAINNDVWLSSMLGNDAYHLKNFADLPAEIPANTFIDAKVDVENISVVIEIQRRGFYLVDTNVQLKCDAISFTQNHSSCRFATPGDEDAVRSIAGNAFSKSRFHLDPSIPKTKADLIKIEWAGNFFKGLRGEWMVVSEYNGIVSGFLQLLKKSESEIIIDLIAVDSNCRKKGFAKAMVAFAYHNCGVNPSINVGTQISNTQSLRFYQAAGFQVISSQYVFHFQS